MYEVGCIAKGQSCKTEEVKSEIQTGREWEGGGGWRRYRVIQPGVYSQYGCVVSQKEALLCWEGTDGSFCGCTRILYRVNLHGGIHIYHCWYHIDLPLIPQNWTSQIGAPQLCHCSEAYCCESVWLLIKVTWRKPTHHSLYFVLLLQPTTEDWCKISSSFAARHLKKVHLHLAGSDINFLESCLSSLSNSQSPQELDVHCGAPGVFSESVEHIHAHTLRLLI